MSHENDKRTEEARKLLEKLRNELTDDEKLLLAIIVRDLYEWLNIKARELGDALKFLGTTTIAAKMRVLDLSLIAVKIVKLKYEEEELRRKQKKQQN